jgi:hypothetical protein
MLLNKDYSEWVQQVIDGNEPALPCYGELLEVKSYIEKCILAIKDHAISEADNFDEKTFQFNGFKFTKVEGKRIYKFDHIKEWIDRRDNLKTFELMAKSAADKYGKGVTMVDDDGQVIEPAIVEYSKVGLSAKIVESSIE